MERYNLKEGIYLGGKIKELENLWLQNNFKITVQEMDKIFLN